MNGIKLAKVPVAIITHNNMNSSYYYRLEDAEALKSTFVSWIGKKAHIGSGLVDILKNISIKPRKQQKAVYSPERFYLIEFEFENKKKFSAHEFLFFNGLISARYNPYVPKSNSGKAA